MKRDTVLYKHIRKKDGIIFYIGIGNKKRPDYKNGRSRHWYNTVKKHGYDVEIIAENLTWDEACELEMLFITFYGRRDLGQGELLNRTNGGEGAYGRIVSDETKKNIGDKHRKDKDVFIQQAIKVHGDKYGYYLVDYVNARIKVNIVCPTHGVFKQRPGDHLRGNGCNKCAINSKADKRRKDSDSFIEDAIKVHGDKYGYYLVDYDLRKTKVNIVCPTHGVFSQTPTSHLSGSGCSDCCTNKKKLTDDDVRWIRDNHKFKDKVYGGVALARRFGVNRTTMNAIINRKTYRDVI
jgi:hypothetical protein